MTHSNATSVLHPEQLAVLRLLDESLLSRRARWFVTRIEPRRSQHSWARTLVGLRNAGLVENVWDTPECSRWLITPEGQRAVRDAVSGGGS